MSQDIVNSQKPLAIYAQVIKGPSPVLNADVTVTITVTKTNGNGNKFNLRLLDDGSGGKFSKKSFQTKFYKNLFSIRKNIA